MTVTLFGLPEYERAFTQFVYVAVHELMAQQNAIFGKIKRVEMPRIEALQNTLPSGQLIEHKPMLVQMGLEFKKDAVICGDVDDLATALYHSAESTLKQIMPEFFKYLGQLCEATGNTVDARGKPISFELMLEMIEKVQINFDESGNPILPTMVVSPELFEAIQKLPPPTEEQKRAWDEVLARKKREFDDRRRHRKLS